MENEINICALIQKEVESFLGKLKQTKPFVVVMVVGEFTIIFFVHGFCRIIRVAMCQQ